MKVGDLAFYDPAPLKVSEPTTHYCIGNDDNADTGTIDIYNGDALIFIRQMDSIALQDRSYEDNNIPSIFWIGGAFIMVYPQNFRVSR